MLRLEVASELTLKVHSDSCGTDVLYTKAGAFIGGECMGNKNFKFDKVLLGPQGNPIQALAGQISRRFTGENLPLMKVTMHGESITYYANEEQHVTVIRLAQGETLSVESENLLAFTSDCKYSIRFLAQGVISQKGWATSTLTAMGANAYVAVLTEGNPLKLSNKQNGATLEVDPDAAVCWVGADTGFKMDLSWKNLLGSRGASGESYMFEWDGQRRASVLVQPKERTSGINLGMDGGSTGSRVSRQQNQTVRQAGQSVTGTLGQLGSLLGGLGGNNGGGNNSSFW